MHYNFPCLAAYLHKQGICEGVCVGGGGDVDILALTIAGKKTEQNKTKRNYEIDII